MFFIMGLFIPVLAPVVVIYNLIYTPMIEGRFPAAFLLGLALMSMLTSFAYLFLKKSRLWLTSFLFCIYYEAVLLWQMPFAWVTFWKSTWGTRLTPEDVRAQEKKLGRNLFNIKLLNIKLLNINLFKKSKAGFERKRKTSAAII